MQLKKFNCLPADRQDKCNGHFIHFLSFHVISFVIIAEVVIDLDTCFHIESLVFEEHSATRLTLSYRLIYTIWILIILFVSN